MTGAWHTVEHRAAWFRRRLNRDRCNRVILIFLFDQRDGLIVLRARYRDSTQLARV